MTENTKGSIKWGAIALAIFIFFYWLIPVNVYSGGIYFFVLVGAIAETVAFVKIAIFINKARKESEYEGLTEEQISAAENRKSSEGYVIMAIILGVLFTSSFLFVFRETQMEEDEIVKYGIVTSGTIVNGRLLASRRMDLSNVTIGFTKQNGDSVWATHSITKEAFENYYRGENVLLIYSSRYPTMIQMFNDIDELNNYERRHGRKLTTISPR